MREGVSSFTCFLICTIQIGYVIFLFLQSSALGLIDKPLENYGKTFAKQVRISPDTIIQMAIQLAYYSLHKRYLFPL